MDFKIKGMDAYGKNQTIQKDMNILNKYLLSTY